MLSPSASLRTGCAKHLGLEREKRFFTALRSVQNDRMIVVQSTTFETEGFSPIPRIGH
jgi:hypothetical protein